MTANDMLADAGPKRLLVSRDTRTDVWTDDQGDKWKPYHVAESRYTTGVWLVCGRGNSYELVVESVYSDEVDARREAMRDRSIPREVIFVRWDSAVVDPMGS